MSDGRVNNGGKRPGSGRPRKVVEAAEQSVLLELFNADAERDVVANMIALASMPSKQAVSAAAWLWDRKYGKVTEKVESSGEQRVIVEYISAESEAA